MCSESFNDVEFNCFDWVNSLDSSEFIDFMDWDNIPRSFIPNSPIPLESRKRSLTSEDSNLLPIKEFRLSNGDDLGERPSILSPSWDQVDPNFDGLDLCYLEALFPNSHLQVNDKVAYDVDDVDITTTVTATASSHDPVNHHTLFLGMDITQAHLNEPVHDNCEGRKPSSVKANHCEYPQCNNMVKGRRRFCECCIHKIAYEGHPVKWCGSCNNYVNVDALDCHQPKPRKGQSQASPLQGQVSVNINSIDTIYSDNQGQSLHGKALHCSRGDLVIPPGKLCKYIACHYHY